MRLTKKQINWYLLMKLPSAFFSRVRVNSINQNKCQVRIKEFWFNQNPFNSLYFACLSMAAELSTGALILSKIKNQKLNCSMLVVKSESEFFKKAKGTIMFTCDNGDQIDQLLETLKTTNTPLTITLHSQGKNNKGDIVAQMTYHWSLKIRN